MCGINANVRVHIRVCVCTLWRSSALILILTVRDRRGGRWTMHHVLDAAGATAAPSTTRAPKPRKAWLTSERTAGPVGVGVGVGVGVELGVLLLWLVECEVLECDELGGGLWVVGVGLGV